MRTPLALRNVLRSPRVSRRLFGPALATALGAVLLGGAIAPVAASPASPVPTITRPAVAPLSAADVTAWLDGLLPSLLEREQIPGAVVSVVADGEVIALGDYGSARADEAAGEDNRLDASANVVRVASISKILTGIAVMQLVQAGELDLDAPIADYLDFTLTTSFDTPITLRHLLSHTAGFEDRVGVPSSSPKDILPLKQWVSTEQPAQIYEPGSTPAYSNYGLDLAGYIVEKTSATPFNTYLSEKVLTPLGMGNSSFAQPVPAELADWLAPVYAGVSDTPSGFEYVNGVPSGALSSTAADMGQLMAFATGALPESSSVLSVENRALMLKPALGEEQLGGLAAAPVMGLAWQDQSRNGHRIYGHAGDLVASHSALQIYPDDGAGIFISLTGAGATADSTSFIRTELMNAFGDRYFPAATILAEADPAAEDEASDGPITGTIETSESTADAHAAIAAGSYELSRTVRSNFGQLLTLVSQVQLTQGSDGTLLVALPAGVGGTSGTAEYHEVAPWLWQEVGSQHLLAMRVNDDVVEAISVAPAFTLLPVEPVVAAPLAVPLIAGALGVLILTIVCWPIAAVLRNRHEVEWPLSAASRAARALLVIAAIAALLAAAGWVFGLNLVLGNDIGIRVLQGLTLVGALGVIPALWNLIQGLRKKRGFGSVFWALLLVAAFAIFAFYAWSFNLFSLDISF